jgi:hypothetical protein
MTATKLLTRDYLLLSLPLLGLVEALVAWLVRA